LASVLLVIAGYRLDPVFERTPDDAVIDFIRYDIHLDRRFVGSRRTHAQCHNLLDELMPQAAEPECAGATIHPLAPRSGCYPVERSPPGFVAVSLLGDTRREAG
jgi:hypothetical protein